MSSALVGGVTREEHPLFEMEYKKVFSFLAAIPDEFLHLLADLDAQKRIPAVEKAIRRRLDPTKDEELLAWFWLLKRVHALTIVVGEYSGVGIDIAEKNLKNPYCHILGATEMGGIYRKHLKMLYTKLPDVMEEGKNIIPIFALPKTKTWILAEIADGWSKDNPSVTDQIDCLCFLSMAADGSSGVPREHQYAASFYKIRGGWEEVVKCVRNLLRERAKEYKAADLVHFLQNQFLQETVSASLWHALIAMLVTSNFGREKLVEMLKVVSW
ncbi:MAG: hypothetical protein G01um101470_728 [Parcubacteria group bacterium Gr01-1014_70]|nr:MAG: hypothetical protein G01um101470_728 [Parcubacteria group bacterium Gr01-1014_70]